MKKRVGLISVAILVVFGILVRQIVPTIAIGDVISDEIIVSNNELSNGRATISVDESSKVGAHLNYLVLEVVDGNYQVVEGPFTSINNTIDVPFTGTSSGDQETVMVGIYEPVLIEVEPEVLANNQEEARAATAAVATAETEASRKAEAAETTRTAADEAQKIAETARAVANEARAEAVRLREIADTEGATEQEIAAAEAAETEADNKEAEASSKATEADEAENIAIIAADAATKAQEDLATAKAAEEEALDKLKPVYSSELDQVATQIENSDIYGIDNNLINDIVFIEEVTITLDIQGPEVTNLAFNVTRNEWLIGDEELEFSATITDSISEFVLNEFTTLTIGGMPVALELDENNILTGSIDTSEFIAADEAHGAKVLNGLAFALVTQDVLGNKTEIDGTITNDHQYYKLEILSQTLKAVVLDDSEKTNSTIASENDKIYYEIVTNIEANITASTIGGKLITLNEEVVVGVGEGASNTYRYYGSVNVVELTTLAHGDIISVSSVIAEDDENIDSTGDKTKDLLNVNFNDTDFGSVTYYEPIVLTVDVFESTNEDKTFVKDSESINIQFTANHEVTLGDVQLLAGKNLTLVSENDNNIGRVFTGSMLINEGEVADESLIEFSCSATDVSEQTTTIDQSVIADYELGERPDTLQEAITYLAPIQVINLSIDTSNLGNRKIARKNTNAVITFETNHETTISSVLVAGIPIKSNEISTDDHIHWTITKKISVGDVADEGEVPFSFNIADEAGNIDSKSNANIEAAQKVYFEDETYITNYSFEGVEANIGTAKDGDTVTLKFTTNHPMTVTSSTIAGRTVTLTSDESHKVWTGTYTVEANYLSDLSEIPYEVVMTDDINEDSHTLTHADTSDVTYYAPIVISNISLVSDNAEDTSVMKNGEHAIVTFTTNHRVTMTSTTIANAVVNFTSSNQGTVWTGKLKASQDLYNDLETVIFNVEMIDAAKNVNSDNQDSTDIVTYYAPIIVSDISIVSDYKDTTIVREGSEAFVSFTTNHATEVTNFTIGGETVSAIPTNANQSWSAHITVTPSMMEDLAALPFEFNVTDIAKNIIEPKTQVDLLLENRVIFQDKIKISDYTFNAPLTDTKQGKNGDEVLLTFTTNHPMVIDTMTIAGQAVTASSVADEGMVWSAVLTLANGLVADQGQIPFNFSMTDSISGDSTSGNQEDLNPVYYNAPIELSNIEFVSDNAKGNMYAINGDLLTLSFETNHPADIIKAQIAGQDIALVSEDNERLKWSADIRVTDKIIEDLANFIVEVEISDDAQNEVVTITNSDVQDIVYYEPIIVSGVSFTSDSSKQSVKNGDSLTVKFSANHKIVVTSSTIGGKSSNTPKNISGFNYGYNQSLSLGSDSDQKAVSYAFSVTDVAGNPVISKNGSDFKFFTSLDLSTATLSSSNATKTIVKNGENIIVSVTGNHSFEITSVIVNGNSVTGYDISKGNGGATVTIPVDKLNLKDQEKISCELTANDDAGNRSSSKSLETNTITYFEPLEVKNFKITNQDELTQGYVKAGDKLTLEFEANHEVIVKSARVAGDDIEFRHIKGTKRYTASYTIKDTLIDNSALEYSISIGDEAGNDIVNYTNKDEKTIYYFAEIELNELLLTNSNIKPEVIRNGNEVALRFTTTHPVEITSAQFGETLVTPVNIDGDHMKWSFLYEVPESSLVDQENLIFTILIDDKAGNTQVNLNQTKFESIRYYEPIGITNVNFISNNRNNSSQYAKIGDSITLSFNANHSLKFETVQILGQKVNVTASENNKYTAVLSMNAGMINDLGTIGFNVNVTDAAGNTNVAFSESRVDNQLTYYAPIVTTSKIEANGDSQRFVKNGDAITISTQANHNISTSRAVLSSKTLVTSGNGTRNLTHVYNIDEEEAGLLEGKLLYELNYTDVAGNILTYNNENVSINQSVIYDRTAPTVEIQPLFEGFTNEDLEFTMLYQDEHLSADGVSLIVNDIELINSDDRQGLDGAVEYSKTFGLADENVYTLVATVTDLAGNVCFQNVTANITIDKTNPEIVTTKIDAQETKRFKQGFIIADYYEINEANLEEIICTISDKSGTIDWDIDTPIESEGKKTIYLMAKDSSGNVSKALTFDVYIDGTAPRVSIADSLSSSLISREVVEQQEFVSEMVLTIELDQLGDELESFDELQLFDGEGNLVMDILDEAAPENGVFQIPISEFAEYSIQAVAVDEVGNSTGVVSYDFELKDKSLVVKYYENKPVFYSTIPLLVIGFFASLVLLSKKIKKVKA